MSDDSPYEEISRWKKHGTFRHAGGRWSFMPIPGVYLTAADCKDIWYALEDIERICEEYGIWGVSDVLGMDYKLPEESPDLTPVSGAVTGDRQQDSSQAHAGPHGES